jgi:hypothetical protein
MLAHHFIQRSVQLAGIKRLAGFNYLAAIPPMSIQLGKNLLLRFPHWHLQVIWF